MYKHTKFAVSLMTVLAMLSSATGTAMAAEVMELEDPLVTVDEIDPDDQQIESVEDDAEDPQASGDEIISDDPPMASDEMDPADQSVTNTANASSESLADSGASVPFNPAPPVSPSSDSSVPSYQEAYNRMVALKKQYPEGMTWTNFEPYGTNGKLGNAYKWKGGKIKGAESGVGCAAFAFILSDEAFGNLPARTIDKGGFTFEDIKVGDILRVNHNSHFVIVLQKSVSGVVIAEGNYNKSVHWGRTMSQSEVMDAAFIVTRYPKNFVPEDDPDANKTVQSGKEGTILWKLTKAGTLTLSGTGAIPNFTSDRLPSWSTHQDSINTIIIENGITSIGDYAFYQSKALNVYIPDSVTSIGNSAFQNSGLMAVTLPGSVKTIGDNAFRDCENLISASISEGLTTIGNDAFRGCISLTHIDFPASIRSIGAGAFMSCKEMTSVRFMPSDQSVTIGDNLFSQCWALQHVTLPQGSRRISAGMFASCPSLPELYISASVTEIGELPFTSCNSLKYIYFGGSEADWNRIASETLKRSLQSTNTIVVFDKKFDDPFAPDPNDPGDLVTDPNDHPDPGDNPDPGTPGPTDPTPTPTPTPPTPPKKKRPRPTTSGTVPAPIQPSEPSVPENPDTPSNQPSTPGTSSKPAMLDTVAAQAAVGGSYCFLVNGNHDLANLQVEVLNPQIASVTLENPNDPRGAMYRVTGNAPGTTQIRVTYQGQSTLMDVTLKEAKGSITLDTHSYTFAPGSQYTIGATLRDESGNVLTEEQVQKLILSGNLKIRDSRTGSIADLQVLPNGNALLTAKNPGTCYILYEIEGKQCSVRIDVQEGISPHGQSVRSTSFWI